MFRSIVVGTDGSETAGTAVRQAVDLAKATGARVELVSAYEPVSGQRLRQETQQVPEDIQWKVNPREDVDATLEEASEVAKEAGVDVEIHARACGLRQIHRLAHCRARRLGPVRPHHDRPEHRPPLSLALNRSRTLTAGYYEGAQTSFTTAITMPASTKTTMSACSHSQNGFTLSESR